jgi:M3 family oligoendopeptidase
MTGLHLDALTLEVPDLVRLRDRHAGFLRELTAWEVGHVGPEGIQPTLEAWDRERRAAATYRALAQLRFSQDTTDPTRRADREQCETLLPEQTDLDVGLKRCLLASPRRTELEGLLGAQAFALWNADAGAFAPAIAADLIEESRDESAYTALLASAAIPFRGQRLNLPGLRPFLLDPDRETRHAAERARWTFFADRATELDERFSSLAARRTRMARTLGLPSFVELAYRRRQRVDWGPEEAARFRDQVRTEVVPVAATLRRHQAARLGIDRLHLWDEGVHHPGAPPLPLGAGPERLDRVVDLLGALHPELGGCLTAMRDQGLLDLDSRPGKADGAFCTAFPSVGLPFVLTSWSGTRADVVAILHEAGHAFQFWTSRHLPWLDELWPTTEACEVHSLGLELLAHPLLERVLGGAAERFRRDHLTDALCFIPYAAAVDELQHWLYAHPDASAGDRHATWKALERTYLPWRRYGDLAHPAGGRFWQIQRHVYLYPFYYLDYALAQVCALQLWASARADAVDARERYVALCRLGGSRPFRALLSAIGLRSPFDPDALRDVIRAVREHLQTSAATCAASCAP